MTASKSYECDATVRILVDTWVAERRCPLPLVDRFLELDLPIQAECARWAATTARREVFTPTETNQPDFSYPYPRATHRPEDCIRDSLANSWYWCYKRPPADLMLWANDTPLQYRGRSAEDEHETALSAILWLIDNWKLT